MSVLREDMTDEKKHRCSITMLRAAEGDCFFLEFFFDDKTFNIMIDSGPWTCWKKELLPFLDKLIQANKRINVLLITHIDADHIGGAINLFEHQNYSNIVDEIWFNGLRQIILTEKESTEKDEKAFNKLRAGHWHDFQEPTEKISAKQSVTLADLLKKEEKRLMRFLMKCQLHKILLHLKYHQIFILIFFYLRKKA